jgi:hypothetical protein
MDNNQNFSEPCPHILKDGASLGRWYQLSGWPNNLYKHYILYDMYYFSPYISRQKIDPTKITRN